MVKARSSRCALANSGCHAMILSMASTALAVPDGTCVYAVGDIHGRKDLLDELHQKIAEDARGRDADRRVVVYLGDYVDRGPDSKAVVESLIRSPLGGFESYYLKGNHEDFLLRFLEAPDADASWFGNGGEETLESYGVAPPETLSTEELSSVRDTFAAALPDDHKRFLDSLILYHVEGDYAFVHAGIRPGVPLDKQKPEDLMWIRDDFLYSEDRHSHMIVHGHTISADPEIRASRIGIDTGAFASGILTALSLCGERRDFLHTLG